MRRAPRTIRAQLSIFGVQASWAGLPRKFLLCCPHSFIIARMLSTSMLLMGLLCGATQAAERLYQTSTAVPVRLSEEPLVPQSDERLRRDFSAKWADLQSRVRAEEAILAACRAKSSNCSAGARRFFEIVELGRQRQGRARLGAINRAVNMSIRPMSDWARHGVDDFWSSPLATLEAGAGDCEDYALVKYVALLEAGIKPDDLRLFIVWHSRHRTAHAVLAVRLDEEWLLLDNMTLILVRAQEATHYHSLLALDLDMGGAVHFADVKNPGGDAGDRRGGAPLGIAMHDHIIVGSARAAAGDVGDWGP